MAPRVIAFHLASPEAGEDFLSERWPELPAISDPDAHFYAQLGAERGSFGKMFALGVWKAGFRAWRKGHRVGKPVGDPWRMPGLFVCEGDTVLFQHPFEHAGDHPEWPAFLRRACAGLEATKA